MRELGNGLAALYVVEEGERYRILQSQDLQAAGSDADQLHAAAMQNLAKRRDEQMQIKRHGEIFAVSLDGFFEASLLLADDLWDTTLAGYAPGGIVAAVPMRNLLAFADKASESAVEELRAVVDRVVRGGEELISTQLFHRENGGWTPWVSGVHDRPEPALSPDLPVVRILLDETELRSILAREVPGESDVLVQVSRPGQVLHFVNSEDGTRSYNLSSVYDEGWRFLHLGVRVNPDYSVQLEALLTKDGRNAREAVDEPGGKAVRLAPFFLPQCTRDPAELGGRGLFDRGLHYAGLITDGRVSLLCICDHCGETFRLQSFHAGFSDLVYMYCSQNPHTLVASSFLEDAPPVLGEANTESVARFEKRLPACAECGGEFRYFNPLRCPHCREPYIDFPRHPEDRAREYYGNYLYGGTPQRWEPAPRDEERPSVAPAAPPPYRAEAEPRDDPVKRPWWKLW
ncbi:MAG TPA: hypothetical protein VF006_29275 [Longimicrobium sp.]